MMIKRIIRYLLAAVITISSLTGIQARNITAEADSAYNALAYAHALELYNEALDSAETSTHLYYNIANTYYRLGDLGRAVLWYERALQLDPTNSDARANLEFVNTRITDKPVDNRSLISRGYDNLTSACHPDTWAWITFTLFTLTVIAFVAYLVTTGVIIRKTCFFGGGVLLILTAFTLSLSLSGASIASRHDNAIIISPSAQLSTAPRAASDADTQAFLLHEGTKVQIVDSVKPTDPTLDSWYEVKVAGNARAWINGRDIERI